MLSETALMTSTMLELRLEGPDRTSDERKIILLFTNGLATQIKAYDSNISVSALDPVPAWMTLLEMETVVPRKGLSQKVQARHDREGSSAREMSDTSFPPHLTVLL